MIFSHEEFMIPRVLMPFKPVPLQSIRPSTRVIARCSTRASPPATGWRDARDEARALTIELTEGLKPAEHCEFLSQFARIMPVTMFLQIVGHAARQARAVRRMGRGDHVGL